MEPDPPLPRRSDDPENLRRLREEARERVRREERLEPTTVYGAPIPVYGGPPAKRWTARGFLLGILAALAALPVWLFGKRVVNPVAVYGGPPPQKEQTPPKEPSKDPEKKEPEKKDPEKKSPPSPPPVRPNPPAPVYGGPPPKRQ